MAAVTSCENAPLKSQLIKPSVVSLLTEETTNQTGSTNQMKFLVWSERGKPEYPGKNLSKQIREPTNSTHVWVKSNSGHIDGRRVLSPLHQTCLLFHLY